MSVTHVYGKVYKKAINPSHSSFEGFHA